MPPGKTKSRIGINPRLGMDVKDKRGITRLKLKNAISRRKIKP